MPDEKKIPVPEIVITMGDPAGIGPEILAKAIKRILPSGKVTFAVVGDRNVLSESFKDHFPEVFFDYRGDVTFVDTGETLGESIPGKPTKEGAVKALKSIEKGLELVLRQDDGRPRALVTSPVSKENISMVQSGFVGHTEFLQEAVGSDFVVMAFVGEKLRVVPLTRHVALKDVSRRLTKDLVHRTIEQVVKDRALLSGVPDPAVIVTALNPHAGEGGKMGDEEKTVIAPAIKQALGKYPFIEGPVPSDVAFYKALSRPGSIVIAMYHDQCLGPFKMLDFNDGVNLTLGLGLVRTSADHGTAFDIAGKGIADPESMESAIKLAIRALSAKHPV